MASMSCMEGVRKEILMKHPRVDYIGPLRGGKLKKRPMKGLSHTTGILQSGRSGHFEDSVRLRCQTQKARGRERTHKIYSISRKRLKGNREGSPHRGTQKRDRIHFGGATYYTSIRARGGDRVSARPCQGGLTLEC